MPLVDVVVVAFNSRKQLRACVEPLCTLDYVSVIVVDNASPDNSLEALDGLPVTAIASAVNGGFAYGCNRGFRAGSAPFVLLLNPDATIDGESLSQLVAVLESDERVGAVAPRIIASDGSLDFSQRRFPRLRSTYARALYLHRIFPRAPWSDETIREVDRYERPGSVEWVSGACMMLRRSALELVNGLDERFFMYCEDKDLCRRLWDQGLEVRYEPRATARHHGGASAPRASLLPVLTVSRVLYAEKHDNRLVTVLERAGLGLEALTRMVVSRGGLQRRTGYARSLRAAFGQTGGRRRPNPRVA